MCYSLLLYVKITRAGSSRQQEGEPRGRSEYNFLLSGILTVLLVLAHSGKGTGVSDMIAASMYNASAGSGIMEKNLDRLTIITTTIFLVCAIVMALTFPVGAIG